MGGQRSRLEGVGTKMRFFRAYKLECVPYGTIDLEHSINDNRLVSEKQTMELIVDGTNRTKSGCGMTVLYWRFLNGHHRGCVGDIMLESEL